MYLMKPYDDALEEILENGVYRTNKRTGIKTLSVFGMMKKYKLNTDYFPIMTRRKTWPKSVFSELVWFLSGSTSNKDLKDLGCNFWTPWVDHEFEKKHGYAEECFGPVYGFQLRHFGGHYGTGNVGEYTTHYPSSSQMESVTYGQGGFDQLAWVVNRIKEDPSCRRMLWTLWNPKDVHKMRLPPCFIAGSMVRTDKGYCSIENISVNDMVHTDKGIGVVDRVWKTDYKGKVLELKPWYMSGTTVTCTPNHPFLVKDKGWVKAEDLTTEDYMAVRIPTTEEFPVFKEIIYKNQYSKREDYKIDSLDDWYMIGYFIGDGWCHHGGKRVSFAINNNDCERVLVRLRRSIKISKKNSESKSCNTYETKSVKWNNILSTLGHKAHNKTMPDWVLNAPKNCLIALLEGYLDADGHESTTHNSFVTTSVSLALSLQLIFAKIGKNAKIQLNQRPSTCVIENRTVNQRNFYTIGVIERNSRKKDGEGKNYIYDGNFIWIKLKEITEKQFEGTVYNLSVKGDHTYTVNNLVNHNCHLMFQVMVDDDRNLTGLLYQRSCDFPIGVPANIQFYSALTIMLAQQTNCKAHEFVHVTADSHIYEDQINGVKEYLSRTDTPSCPKVKINKASDIFSYKPEDFTVVDYNPLPKIDIPVAV